LTPSPPLTSFLDDLINLNREFPIKQYTWEKNWQYFVFLLIHPVSKKLQSNKNLFMNDSFSLNSIRQTKEAQTIVSLDSQVAKTSLSLTHTQSHAHTEYLSFQVKTVKKGGSSCNPPSFLPLSFTVSDSFQQTFLPYCLIFVLCTFLMENSHKR